MSTTGSNIEIVAREVCARLYLKHSSAGPAMQADIDRHWHIVAAKLEAGLMREDGTEVPDIDVEAELAAVRDWRSRHPQHVVPPPMKR